MRPIVCETPEQIQMAQALRYEVFCLEKEWIDPSSCENGLEIDEYDEFAVHFLVLDEETGEALGTCRLLLGAYQTLPAAGFLDLAALGLLPAQACEVSRLASVRAARSHSLEVFLGLMQAMATWGAGSDIRVLLSVADVPLHRLMTRIGMPFLAEGEPVEYLGSECIPSVIDVARTGELLARVSDSRLETV
jgi:N-acyl-L-homoserine lactone synthetase